MNYLEFFCMRDVSILLQLLMYLNIYLCQFGFMDMYFRLWVIIQYCCLYFVIQQNIQLKLFQLCYLGALSFGDSFVLSLCFVFSTFSLSGTTRCSRFILYALFSSPTISYFYKEPCFLSLDNGIRSQNLGTRSAQCY